MTTSDTNAKYFQSDEDFNELYPANMQRVAARHFTPVRIAKLAADFLTTPGSKILDIGSGAGKFCIVGAAFHNEAEFIGIEQRSNLIKHGLRAQRTLGLQNVSFLNGNFTQLNLHDFDHFYFFNSFYENVDKQDRIDEKVEHSTEQYVHYERYLYEGLKKMPSATRLVTYHARLQEIPKTYTIVNKLENGDLKFWIKN